MDWLTKNTEATLAGLAKRWNPPGLISDGHKINDRVVYGLLPDIIDPEKAQNNPCLVLSNAVQDFATGCWRKDKDKNKVSYLQDAIVKSLLPAILFDSPICYNVNKECTHYDHSVGCKTNMLNKIYYYVLQSDTKPIDNLLSAQNVQLHPFPENQSVCVAPFRDALQRLYMNGTKESLTYGIFLLVMHSVFHRNMSDLFLLYCGEKFDAIVEKTRSVDTSKKILPDNHTYFIDPFYSHPYHAYIFRDNYDRLYENGLLKLECSKGIPSASLKLEDSWDSNSHTISNDPVSHHYIGTPILSRRDSLVYILLRDTEDQDALGFLVFQYTAFSNKNNCYYRSGLFVSSNHRHNPEVRKIVITERRLTEEELPLVKGILRTTNRQVILSESQLEKFFEDHKEKYPNIDLMKDALLPHHKNWYCFADKLVGALADPALDELERLKLMLSIKSYCVGTGEPLTQINCEDGEGIYKIMR